MMPEGTLAAGAALSPVIAGLGVGVALASAPGPVQALLLAESVRGGVARGFRALAGANLMFGLLLVCLALGLSLVAPRGRVLGVLQLAGGAFLLWVATEGFRYVREVDRSTVGWIALPPSARGALAVLLNPGAWLFLGAVAPPLFASANQHGGTASALIVAVVVMAGIAVGDGTVVLLAGIGVRRASDRAGMWIRWLLAGLLAGFGVWLVVAGLVSLTHP